MNNHQAGQQQQRYQHVPTTLAEVMAALGFHLPAQVYNQHALQSHNDQTVFLAIARALRKQHQVLETGQTVTRLFAAINRDKTQYDPRALVAWRQGLFENEAESDDLPKKFAMAGLPRATLAQTDAFKAAWSLTLKDAAFGDACVFMIVVEQFNTPGESMSLHIQDPALDLPQRIIRHWREIKNLYNSSPNAVWVLNINNKNYHGLEPCLQVGVAPGLTQFNVDWKSNKKNVLSSMHQAVNVSLAGYLPINDLMDHTKSYFLINKHGLSTIAPFEHSLGLGVTVHDFVHEYVDMDSLLVQGTNIDTLARNYLTVGQEVACPGSVNRPVPELGGKKSHLEWIQITSRPTLYLRRRHGDVARERLTFWMNRDLKMHGNGHFHDSETFSIPSPIFKLFLQDLRDTLVAAGDTTFEFVCYSFGQQSPCELTEFVNDFIKHDFYVISDIATTFTEVPLGHEPPEGQQAHVLLFKPIKTDQDGAKHRYNKPEFHPIFSHAQGRRCSDEMSFGGARWENISKKQQKPGKPFQGIQCVKLYPKWFHSLRQYFKGEKDKLPTRTDVLRHRGGMFNRLWNNLATGWARLGGFRVESTVHLTDEYNNVVGPLEQNGYPSFQSYIDRGMKANRLLLEVCDTVSFTVDELLYSSLCLNMFFQASFDDKGYELFCNTEGHARSHGGYQGPGRPQDVNAHRRAMGACLMDDFGNSSRAYKNASSVNRHNIMLVRYEDYFSSRMLHPIEAIDSGVWRRFTR